MSLDTTNLVFSMVILQRKRIDRAKAMAASVGAALIPGPIGLVVPAIVASGIPDPRPRPDTPPPPADTGIVRVKVPDVLGQLEEAAVRVVRAADLTPVTSTTFSSAEDELGRVVDQDPAADEYAQTGSEVDLTIAHAPAEEEQSESEKEDEILKVVHQIADKIGAEYPAKSSRRRTPDQGSSGSGSTS